MCNDLVCITAKLSSKQQVKIFSPERIRVCARKECGMDTFAAGSPVDGHNKCIRLRDRVWRSVLK